jgi:hypothetical protein
MVERQRRTHIPHATSEGPPLQRCLCARELTLVFFLCAGHPANENMAKKLQAIGYKDEEGSEMDVRTPFPLSPALLSTDFLHICSRVPHQIITNT